MFGNPLLASTALDRLLHHAHVLVIEGDSYRNPPRTGIRRRTGRRRRRPPPLRRPRRHTQSAWPNQAVHAVRAQLAHADDAEVAISFAEPGAISEASLDTRERRPSHRTGPARRAGRAQCARPR
jgi:hypothetical protein